MRINDLVRPDLALREGASLMDLSPLTQADMLQEAQVLDIRFDALTGVAGLLFELRQALQLEGASTGVLVARGVRVLTWSGGRREAPLTAWSIGSSVPSVRDCLFDLSLVMWPHPGARLTLTAEHASFFVGDVPGLPAAPPDYSVGSRGTVASQLAEWDSSFEVTSAAFLDPKSLGR